VPVRQEDFVFAEHILRHGYATEAQVQECLSLLDRLRAEMQIEESLSNLMVKKGYLATAQVHVIEAEIDPNRAGRPRNAIEGYRLLERIGSGAMGSVYKAHHLKLSIPVALKVLRPSLASSRTQIERLRREAQLAARLNHVNIVRSLDVGESNGFHYLAMEFVEGTTVRELLDTGPLPEKEALRIVRQIASGLAAAHAQGVIHRDVKPANIMLTPDGTPKLADFGLARGQEPSDLTLEHASIGTPQYVAPEQMRRGADATARSDLFSLGATLYHMVTGRAPFDGETLGEVVQNVLACRFPPPESLVQGLSRDATYVIDRLMRADPHERYASAQELVDDLERIERGEQAAPADFLGDYQLFLRRRRARRNAVLGTIAAVAACAGLLFLFLHRREAERARLETRCEAVTATGSDVDGRRTAADLGAAADAMDRALAASGECPREALDPLRKRLAKARSAWRILVQAEHLGARADAPDANYREIDAKLAALRPGLGGAEEGVAALRENVRRASDAAAEDRHTRQIRNGFREFDAMAREVRAFAADLETRYLPSKADWAADVLGAPRLLEEFERAWAQLAADRARLDDALSKRNYRNAAFELQNVLNGEKEAGGRLLASPYLRNFLHALPGSRDRGQKLFEEEMAEWQKVLPSVDEKMEEDRPDLAEEELEKFRERASATSNEVERRLRQAKERKDELLALQMERYRTEDALFRERLRQRRYAAACDGVAAVQSGAWLRGIDSLFAQLGSRAEKVASLPDRFLDRVRRQKKVVILGQEVAGDQIEPAPGPDRDRFVARHAKGKIGFSLADLSWSWKELEAIFAFDASDPIDRARRGYFREAEAFREEMRDPYEAVRVREFALEDLGDDPWTANANTELELMRQRNRKGEERAQQAQSELETARKAADPVKALALVRELLETLHWTNASKPHLAAYERDREDFERRAQGGLLHREAGVPADQFVYGGADRPTEIILRGRKWHHDEGGIPKDAPDREAQLDRMTREYWAPWFRAPGRPEAEVQRLVERAKSQLLLWSGPVETGAEGGYRPTDDARMKSTAEWMARAKPEVLALAFPFRIDQPWSIEFEVRWPTAQPGYFVVAAGQFQAAVGYFDAGTRGGMAGVCLLVGEDLDPGAHAKQLSAFHWHLVREALEKKPPRRPTEGAYLDRSNFTEGVPYRMRLERTSENRIRFEMWPARAPDGKRVTLERSDVDPRQMKELMALGDGPPLFRFFGAPPAKGVAYELHDVKIAGIVAERRTPEAARQ
jgi:serine/threonine-protein kinase